MAAGRNRRLKHSRDEEKMKTILTCAVTGNLTRPDQNSELPITPAEIAQSCLDVRLRVQRSSTFTFGIQTGGRQCTTTCFAKVSVESSAAEPQ